MNVLLLGGGGREHALAWKIAQSPQLGRLWVAPGNAGTLSVAENLNISETDFLAIKQVILDNDVHMLVVGPEAPLVKGIREYIECDSDTEHVKIVGPGREGAKLEGSKSFSKDFMHRHKIPTAKYGKFNAKDLDSAKAFLDSLNPPYVLKADGLAGGKGVLIIDDIDEAKKSLEEMLVGGKFGAASTTVVIEEFLKGIELSVFILTDGKTYVLLPEAKDYKRIGVGDTGLNTGGMGSISPVPFANEAFMQKVKDRIIEPSVNGLKKDRIPYNGFLFIGLMNCDGDPYVIEYNCRMGDPETESVIPRIDSDLVSLLAKCADGELENAQIEVNPETVTSIMLVSGGYPENYEKGKQIYGLENVNGSLIFHAGTMVNQEGAVVTNGGRVMTVTSYGDDIQSALNQSYSETQKLYFEGMYFRNDIGFDLD
ncbi:MAG: phosphoribosylamine--glycine ligase [Flavobacteriales bacterium]